jgi:hypothetical protein
MLPGCCAGTWRGPESGRKGEGEKHMATSAEIRERLATELRLDLVGPSHRDDASLREEILPDPPSCWYLAGFLVPLGAPPRQKAPDPEEEMDAVVKGGAFKKGRSGAPQIWRALAGCGNTLLSFRVGPSGPGPEPMSGRCSWIPRCLASLGPRNDAIPAFFRTLRASMPLRGTPLG